MIPRQISSAFPPAVIDRGRGYASAARVSVSQASGDTIIASVRGSSRYRVTIEALPGLITADCSCPYAADNGVCKHIWATLSVADLNQQLEPLVRTAGVGFRFAATGMYDDLDTDIPAPRKKAKPQQPRPPEWKRLLDRARSDMQRSFPEDVRPPAAWPSDRRVVYIINLAGAEYTPGLLLELAIERRKRDDTWEPPVGFRIPAETWQRHPDPLDRQIAQMLIGAGMHNPYGYSQPRTGPFVLSGASLVTVLPRLCETGRCRVRRDASERPVDPVTYDDGPPWQFVIRVTRTESDDAQASAILRRPDREMPLSAATLLHSQGILLVDGTFARFDHGNAFPLVPLFRQQAHVALPANELPALIESLYALPRRPPIELPAESRVSEQRAAPRPGIVVRPDPSAWRTTHRRIDPFFEYGTRRLTGLETEPSFFERETLTVFHRDVATEQAAFAHLRTLGARDEWHYGENQRILAIPATKLGRAMGDLVATGWRVEAEGRAYRAAGSIRASVTSGIDWFELSATVSYGDVEVSLHELLEATRAGETSVELPGGDLGLIPSEWLGRIAPLAAGATPEKTGLRFKRSQTALLDALLAAVPEPDVDTIFEKARDELRRFERIAPSDPPPTFKGTLREYQREGLGWLHFLRTFNLGGCLADDMGLGKTVQVLALLESRRSARRKNRRPSIVVVPRSLVFNWLREAERFAPKLRLLDYTGPDRDVDAIANCDVVITTYGTLRRDCAQLAAVEFDYAILDEAQAIKSANSASAKAARLLRAEHRLAMTGTPIENRLEELWSLFEFLNPGMLGAATTFASLVRLSRDGDLGSTVDRSIVATALRPVILRRTKAQVAPELPPRTEQTLHVELEGAQRKFYDALLESFRGSVLERVDRVGLGKARMHILEALLRLRQAVCHPALVDARKRTAPSAKLDALIPALEEVIAGGHKALVFSQFTTFLDLLRERLDGTGIVYEYLDGKTRDRQARVDRFQTDAACPLFLISLKAGGHGLNLTAAEYVFILDPWWNPAVEAQAVDRAHRIGQTKHVIATRIVAKGTIEEKILELQASKRALADAILGQDQGVLSQIGRAELEMLLG